MSIRQKTVLALVLAAAFLAPHQTTAETRIKKVPQVEQAPQVNWVTSSTQVQQNRVMVAEISEVGKVEVDANLKVIIFTKYTHRAGGMEVALFCDGVHVRPSPDFVYNVEEVPLREMSLYVVSIAKEDEMKVVFFRVRRGKVAVVKVGL